MSPVAVWRACARSGVGSEKCFFEKRRIAHNGIEGAGVAKGSAMIVVQKIGTKHVDC